MSSGGAVLYRRFGRNERLMHGLMMLSFLGLAYTGLPLLFHDAAWAGYLARFFGGFRSAGLLHRTFACVMIGVFVVHVMQLLHRLYVRRELEILWGPTSLVPQPRDVIEMIQHLRWFARLGPRPRFDHFTYWEKFDYWAVFWGMAIIGGSGLVLWFPALFSAFLPGWFYNVALLVHREEALLAVGFIFTIHFFNGHLRPEKFPMDTVIFTGRISEHDLAEERPEEYERLGREGRLEFEQTDPPAAWVERLGKAVGTAAVALGLLLVALIVYAVLI